MLAKSGMTSPNHNPSGRAIDRLGALASTACAVHCLLAALLPGAIAALGLGVVLGHDAESAFTLTAVAIASLALVLGWPKHRSGRIAATLVFGIVGLVVARVLEQSGSHVAGTMLGVGAGLALVAGHVFGVRALSGRA